MDSYLEMFERELKLPTFSGDAEGDAAFVEAGKPALTEAARLTGWAVESIDAVRYNGMGPRTNTRVWNKSGVYMDVKLPDHLLT